MPARIRFPSELQGLLLLGILALSPAVPAGAEETLRFDQMSLGELADVVRERTDLAIPGLRIGESGAGLQLRGVTVVVSAPPAVSLTAIADTEVLAGVTATLMLQVLRVDGAPHALLSFRPHAFTLGDLYPGFGGPAAQLELPSAVFTVAPGLSLPSARKLDVPSSALSETARQVYTTVYGADEFTLELGAGVNVLSRWSLSSLPEVARRNFEIDPAGEIVVEGYLGLGLAGLVGGDDAGTGGLHLRGTLPTPGQALGSFPAWLSDVRMTELTFELAYDDAAAFVRIGSRFEADLDRRRRKFVGSTVLALAGGPAGFELSAAMEESWEKPFGVDWLTLEEVGMSLTLDSAGGAAGRFHGFFSLGESRVSTDLELAATGDSSAVRFTGTADRVSTAALRDLLRKRARDSSLEVDFPARLDELRDVTLDFSADSETALSLSGTAVTRIDLDGEPRQFTISAALNLAGGEIQADFEGRLTEVWERPFGVDWLRLDDVSVELSAESGDDPMAGGTLRSWFELGETRVGLEIELDKAAEGTSARFTGSVERISLRDFTELVRKQIADPPLAGSRLNLTIHDLRMTLEVGSRRSFSVAGRTNLNGREAEMLLFSALEDGRRHVVTGFRMSDWSLADAVPVLEGTLVESFEFSSVALMVTRATGRLDSASLSPEAYEFFQRVQASDEFTLDLQPGVTLVGSMPLPADSPLNQPLETLGSSANQVLAIGTLPAGFLGLDGGGGFTLRAELPEMSPRLPNGSQPPWFRSGQLSFFIEAGPEGVGAGLEGSLNVTIDETDMSFIVAGEFAGPPVAIALSGRLAADQPWVSPYGIEWLTVRQVGAALDFNPVTLSLGLGFDGDVDLGQKNVQVAISLALNVTTGVPTNFIFRGASTTPWAVSDLVEFQQQMARAAGRSGRIPTEKVPNFEIRPIDELSPIEIKFALRASDEIEAGVAISGALWAAIDQSSPPELLGEVDCAVGVTGIEMYGSVPRELRVAGLSLSEPLVDLDLALLPPAASFVLTGDVAFPWFTRTIDVELGGQGRVAEGLSRAARTAALFRDYSQAFRADPVGSTESSLTGESGLLAVAGVPPPPWLHRLFETLDRVRQISPESDSRALLEQALTGIEVTIPAGEGRPAGGEPTAGCLATQQLVGGRCWLIPPFAGEELGYSARCVPGALEDGTCWLVRPSSTTTRSKVTRRRCAERNRAGRCTRFTNDRICPAGTTEQAGTCYVKPPGPPRRAMPSEPSRVCAGVEAHGRCWKIGRSPREGTPEGGADPACPVLAPIYSGGRCWRLPPRPTIQIDSIAGVCSTAAVSCTVDGLLDDTISPLIRDAVSGLLAPFESTR